MQLPDLPILAILDAVQASLAAEPTLIVQAPPGAGKSTVLPLALMEAEWLDGQKILLLEPRRLAARSVAVRMADLLGEKVGERVGYRVRFETRVSARTQIEVVTENILTRMLHRDPDLEGIGMVIFDEFHERSLNADLALVLSREVQAVLREDLRLVIMSATLDTGGLAALLGNAPVVTSEGRQFPVSLRYLDGGRSGGALGTAAGWAGGRGGSGGRGRTGGSGSGAPGMGAIAAFVAKGVRRALRETEGDVLVFLPGTGAIRRCQELLEESNPEVAITPLYGDLPFDRQQAALMPDPDGFRRVVLATSIAETSLTIDGIAVVVDSGFARVPRFDSRSGLTRLETVAVTLDAADQRMGRAGRLGPGICYRLWEQGAHQHLVARRQAEILSADLAPLVLELAQWGVGDVFGLDWPDAPPGGALRGGIALLVSLEAVEGGSESGAGVKGSGREGVGIGSEGERGVGGAVGSTAEGAIPRITARGTEMLRMPTHPRLAHLLLEGRDLGLSALAADLAALLEERDPLGRDVGADLALRVEALRRFRNGGRRNADRRGLERVERLAKSWRRLLKVDRAGDEREGGRVGLSSNERGGSRAERGSSGVSGRTRGEKGSADGGTSGAVDPFEVGRLLAAAYPERIAKLVDAGQARYRLSQGRKAVLDPADPLGQEQWLAVAHLDAGMQEGRIYLAAPLHPDDLKATFREQEVVFWDHEAGRLTGRLEQQLGGLAVSSVPLKEIPEARRIAVLCEAVRAQPELLPWTEGLAVWQARVGSLRVWRPEEDWPDVSREALLAGLENWLGPFLGSVRRKEDFKQLDLKALLQGLLPWPKPQELDTLTPERFEVPSGSKVRLEYFEDGRPPVLAARVQELFGQHETPRVNGGRTAVLVHLLSPARRPVQITQDLKNFWQNTYAEVRKDLRGRYSKHYWPEDPFTAEAIRGVRPRRGE